MECNANNQEFYKIAGIYNDMGNGTSVDANQIRAGSINDYTNLADSIKNGFPELYFGNYPLDCIDKDSCKQICDEFVDKQLPFTKYFLRKVATNYIDIEDDAFTSTRTENPLKLLYINGGYDSFAIGLNSGYNISSSIDYGFPYFKSMQSKANEAVEVLSVAKELSAIGASILIILIL
jgi:hypothetical protein